MFFYLSLFDWCSCSHRGDFIRLLFSYCLVGMLLPGMPIETSTTDEPEMDVDLLAARLEDPGIDVFPYGHVSEITNT